jgi:ribosomal protein L13
VDFNVETNKQINHLSSELGMWLWNIAVSDAPIDTGNLRKAITMTKNGAKSKQYVYNALNAVYLHYLEEGLGPIKKHKGFISEKTVGDFIQEIIYYVKTGKTGLITTPPVATLQMSKNGKMFYEKKIANSLGWSGNQLSADDRKKLSQIRYRYVANSNKASISGEKPTSRYLYKRSQNRKTNVFWLDEVGYQEKNSSMALALINRK